MYSNMLPNLLLQFLEIRLIILAISTCDDVAFIVRWSVLNCCPFDQLFNDVFKRVDSISRFGSVFGEFKNYVAVFEHLANFIEDGTNLKL